MIPLDRVYLRSPAWAQTLAMNAYALQVERHRYGRAYRAAVRRLLEQQYWTRERIEAYQDERLRAVVRTAYERSPYYRRLMVDAGLGPSDIGGVRDLGKLPILTKEAVRRHGNELRTHPSPRRGWLHGHTSGTTGSPLSLWYDRDTCIMTNAVDRRQKIWGGMKEGDWIGVFLGRVVVPPRQIRPPFWRANHVQHQVWFSTFHMSDTALDHYIDEIRRRKLRFLEGYPSTLFILARYLRQRGTAVPMRAVFTSSETLHALQREAIESAFQCNVFDFYGHAERTIFAAECEARAGKHLADEYGYTEVVDEHGNPVPDGDIGYLVGTSLHNTAMPLIRYRTGDLSAIQRETCGCGRTLTRIRDIATKAEDIVVTPDGRMVSPSILTHPFKPFDQIVKSQIVQERPDRILIKIVPSAEFTAEHERSLLDGLQRRLGPGITLEVLVVDDIPQEPSGKFRWVISHVDHSCRFSWETMPGRGAP